MSTCRPAVVAAALAFEPDLARRRLSGTIFLGVCLLAIGILLLALCSCSSTCSAKGFPGSTWTS